MRNNDLSNLARGMQNSQSMIAGSQSTVAVSQMQSDLRVIREKTDLFFSYPGEVTTFDPQPGINVRTHAKIGTTLSVKGVTKLKGDLKVNTDKFTVASASGNTNVKGALDVTGTTTLRNNLIVNGTITQTGRSGISGGLTLGETLDVAGTTTLSNTVIDTLSVTGATTLTGDLGATTINASGTVGVNGDFDVATDKFTVASASGNTAIAGTLGVTGVVQIGTGSNGTLKIGSGTMGGKIHSTINAHELVIDPYALDTDINTKDASGQVVILGDLIVKGNTTTVHSENVVIKDHLLTIANGSTTSDQTDGAGINVGDGYATFVYNSTGSGSWETNIGLEVTGATILQNDLTVNGSITGASQNIANWDTAYSWGDHSLEGYLTDAHPAHEVTSNKIINWDTSYSWGDHSLEGYLTDGYDLRLYIPSAQNPGSTIPNSVIIGCKLESTGHLYIGTQGNVAPNAYIPTASFRPDHLNYNLAGGLPLEIGTAGCPSSLLDLGTNLHKWRNIWSTGFVSTDALYSAGDTNVGVDLNVGSDATIGGSCVVNGALTCNAITTIGNVIVNNRLGIGTTNPIYNLDVNGVIQAAAIRLSGSRGFIFHHTHSTFQPHLFIGDIEYGRYGWDFKYAGAAQGMGNTLFRCYTHGTGNLVNNGHFQVFCNTYGPKGWQTSDDRYKHGEFNITNGLETIRQLVPKTYKKTSINLGADNDGTNIGNEDEDWSWESGLIAQEIEKIPTLNEYVTELDGYKYVSYNDIHTHTIAGLKELDAIVTAQADTIQAQKTEIEELKNQNNTFKNALNQLLLESGRDAI